MCSTIDWMQDNPLKLVQKEVGLGNRGLQKHKLIYCALLDHKYKHKQVFSTEIFLWICSSCELSHGSFILTLLTCKKQPLICMR